MRKTSTGCTLKVNGLPKIKATLCAHAGAAEAAVVVFPHFLYSTEIKDALACSMYLPYSI